MTVTDVNIHELPLEIHVQMEVPLIIAMECVLFQRPVHQAALRIPQAICVNQTQHHNAHQELKVQNATYIHSKHHNAYHQLKRFLVILSNAAY
jgi:hypothetical protein